MCKSDGLLFLLNIFLFHAASLSNSCAFFCWVKEATKFQWAKNKPSPALERNEPFLITAIKCNSLMWVPCQGWQTDQQVLEKHLLMCRLDQLELYCTWGEQYRTSSRSGANTDDVFIHSQPDCLVLCPFPEKRHSGNRPLTAEQLGMGLLFVSAWAEHHQRCQTASHELRVLQHQLSLTSTSLPFLVENTWGRRGSSWLFRASVASVTALCSSLW